MIETEIPNIDINEAKKLIRSRLLAKQNGNSQVRPIMLWGHAGIGKSQIIEQVAQECGVGFQALNMATLEAPDLQGLPTVHDRKTEYARPNLMPTFDSGVWLLDELNRAPLDLRQGLMQLLTTNEINGHKLGANVLIVAAGNLSDGEVQYSVDDLDPALMDRFAHFKLRPTVDNSVNYLTDKHNSNHLAIRWLKSDPTMLGLSGKGVSPRSFDALCSAITGCPDVSPFLLICGEAGRMAGGAFLGWYESPASLVFDDLWAMRPGAAEALLKLQEGTTNIEFMKTSIEGYKSKFNTEKAHDSDTITRLGWFLELVKVPEWRMSIFQESDTLFGQGDVAKANLRALKVAFPKVRDWMLDMHEQIVKYGESQDGTAEAKSDEKTTEAKPAKKKSK